MKFLFTHCYSKQNRGDAAIIATMLRRFRNVFPNSRITLATLDHFEAGETFESAPQVHSFFYTAIYTSSSGVVRAAHTVWVVVVTVLWALLFRVSGFRFNISLSKALRETLEEYVLADVVVPVGGGYLLGKDTIHDTLTVVLQLHAIAIALLLNKPVLLFSQSIGPFANWLQKFLTGVVLSRVQVIMVREALSKQNLEELGVSKPRVVETADAAFLFEIDADANGWTVLERFDIPAASRMVGITVRNWLSMREQEAYERAMASFAAWLITEGFAVVFVPQVSSSFHNDDDAVVQSRIQQALPPGTDGVYFLPSTLTFTEVKAVFASCEYVVGTRMHSVIFALTSGVPALAIAYERKTLGIMSSFGLQDYVIPMEMITFELLQQKFSLLQENRSEYLAQLNVHMPIEKGHAGAAFEKVQSFVAKKGFN